MRSWGQREVSASGAQPLKDLRRIAAAIADTDEDAPPGFEPPSTQRKQLGASGRSAIGMIAADAAAGVPRHPSDSRKGGVQRPPARRVQPSGAGVPAPGGAVADDADDDMPPGFEQVSLQSHMQGQLAPQHAALQHNGVNQVPNAFVVALSLLKRYFNNPAASCVACSIARD